MNPKIKNQKWIWVVGITLVLVIIVAMTNGDGTTSQRAQVSQPLQQETREQAVEGVTEKETTEKVVEQERIAEAEKARTEQEKPPPPEVSVTTNIVDYVIDGDTVELRDGERVRLIGINTPEMGQPYSAEAKNKLKELIEGKQVNLEKDITERDQYGRLLRYIWLDNTLINLKMVRLGYANSYTYPPDVKYQDQIIAAEREARESKIGLWAPAEAGECIIVSYMHADAAGNDNYNLNDEYIIFKNICSQEFNMANWTVKDEATHIFTFSGFYLASQATITLYSGSGTNTTDKLYWNRADERYAIWNNDGDTVYLRDAAGNLVLEYSY
jgi:micrococcal nuclease